MSTLSTHVLDTSLGRPAAHVPVALEAKQGSEWKPLGLGVTNEDGRIKDLLPAGTQLKAGTYRLTFDTAEYAKQKEQPLFYPSVTVTFVVGAADEHYHVPLLLSPYGFSTYRGS